jgi:recombinase, phage RecT family
MADFKETLAQKAETQPAEIKVTKEMSIADTIKAMQPEIKKALPSVISPERFTRMALSALNTNKQLLECTKMSFITALMNAAQLGLEPNTPLGQAYLIPYKSKDKVECKFILGYKGMLDLVYRNENVQSIQAQIVYENDVFEYTLGLDARLYHKPALAERGEMIAVYAVYKLQNGGYGFEVMSKDDVIQHAERFSQGINSKYSPWTTDFESMAKKTAIKKLLKYAPLKTESLRAISSDETIKHELSVDMTEIVAENDVIEA